MRNKFFAGVVLSACLFTLNSFAGPVETAIILLQQPRGPLGPNETQLADRRLPAQYGTTEGGYFKAAFRTPEAQNLARNDGLYLGNLFSTNYYELVGEFVYGGPDSNHVVDHPAAVRQAVIMNRRATSMIRSWILEKHYVHMLPNSNLARAFNNRAISDVESERGYADYFFDLYLNSMTAEPQYLLAAQLIKYSPIEDTASFTRARDMATVAYDQVVKKYGAGHPLAVQVYELRNMVHNHMSPSVISLITRFLADTPAYEAEGFTELRQVRDSLVEYYSQDANKIIGRARTINDYALTDALIQLQNNPASESALMQVSNLIVTLKSDLVRHQGFQYRTTLALQLILGTSQLLSRYALDVANPTSKTAEILLNSVYGEGFLIADNRQYFQNEIRQAQTPADIKRVLMEIVDVSMATLNDVMGPTLTQWYQIEPKVRNFADSAVKSSSLNALSIFAARIK